MDLWFKSEHFCNYFANDPKYERKVEQDEFIFGYQLYESIVKNM